MASDGVETGTMEGKLGNMEGQKNLHGLEWMGAVTCGVIISAATDALEQRLVERRCLFASSTIGRHWSCPSELSLAPRPVMCDS
jgi:hypothetical protein